MASFPFPAEELWSRVDPDTAWRGDWRDFRHRQLWDFLQELIKFAPFDLGLAQVGLSDEGRALWTLRFGNPKGRRVFLWARQHGNEPDCTAGLCAVLTDLVLNAQDPFYQFLLENLEIGVFPMVNPDGVARFTRENAQGIDVNRDAIALSTPEGRAIHEIKQAFAPEFCFNLHDMGPRKATKNSDLVALSLQAGPFCEEDVDNEVRLRAKEVCANIHEACSVRAQGHIARYEVDYLHRAFGDSMMRWGVSSILIEAGGWVAPEGDRFVRRLFAHAVLRGLHSIANGEINGADGGPYEAIPFDGAGKFADVLLRGGMVMNGSGFTPCRADIHVDRVDGAREGDGRIPTRGEIVAIGDLSDLRSKQEIDASSGTILPGLVVLAPNAGMDRDLPDAGTCGRFLRAGITTVGVGVGPFLNAQDREQWAQGNASRATPLNIAAFEVIEDFAEIRARHGMTELYGMLLRGLVMEAAELLAFAQLFYPVRSVGLGHGESARPVGVELFYLPSLSPGTTQLRLHLTPLDSPGERKPLDQVELRTFAAEFIRHPSQISLVSAMQETGLSWLPIMVDPCGWHGTDAPPPNFLGEALSLHGTTQANAMASVISMLTRRSARALRLEGSGIVDRGRRADLILLDSAPFQPPFGEKLRALAPREVLVNGVPMLSAGGTPGRVLMASSLDR